MATVATPKVEAFYWAAITFSQTLGTALGDWIADDTGLGYEGGALLFAAALVGIIGLYFGTNISRVFLFWTAFILTRPLGATVGDFLDKPVSDGGLALSRHLHRRSSARSSSPVFSFFPKKWAGSRADRSLHPKAPTRISLIGPKPKCLNIDFKSALGV